eukprot:1159965-Pelagomonas_calceolata.AAC.18
MAVDAVQPPPRPSTVPQALQQAMPLADVLNLIAKPPGSAPPFIPYKPVRIVCGVPYLVPLPGKHTLPVKAPFKYSASAFGDLREDNLQLIIQLLKLQRFCHYKEVDLMHALLMQAKRIIKTQTQMYVEDIEVKVVEEREPWTLPMSIFKPRLKESDARNFFDTPAVSPMTIPIACLAWSWLCSPFAVLSWWAWGSTRLMHHIFYGSLRSDAGKGQDFADAGKRRPEPGLSNRAF